jgi:hypothetical protein
MNVASLASTSSGFGMIAPVGDAGEGKKGDGDGNEGDGELVIDM